MYLAIEFDLLRDDSMNLTAKVVFAYLLGWKKSSGLVCPSQQRIADDLNIGRDTVNTAINTLVKLGYVQKTKRFNNSIIYQLAEVGKPDIQLSENPTTVVGNPAPINLDINLPITLVKEVKRVTDDDDAPINITSFPCTSSKVKCGWSLDDLEESPF